MENYQTDDNNEMNHEDFLIYVRFKVKELIIENVSSSEIIEYIDDEKWKYYAKIFTTKRN